MICKTEEELKFLKHSSLLVGKTLAEVSKWITPGANVLKLDKIAEDFILSQDAKPAFKGYGGFPASLCISINDEVVHGIPADKTLKEGDIVSIDCGVIYKGFYGDSAYTFEVGEVSLEVKNLLKATKESLYLGIKNAIVGNRTGDIGFAIQSHVESKGYSVVRELVGHGVGRNLHEAPEVPNYGKRGSGAILQEGMVIAIEPMVNLGVKNIQHLKDGWTIATKDGKPSAHFEHTVIVRKNEAEVLSTFEYIEKVNIK